MMNVIDAPRYSMGRTRARLLLAQLPANLMGDMALIRFPDRAIVTSSFVDETVRELFLGRGTRMVTFVGMPTSARATALDSAIEIRRVASLKFQ